QFSARQGAAARQAPQGLPGVQPRGVAVVPGEADGVVADVFHALELQVRADRRRVQHALAGPLVAARGARALGAEVAVSEPADLALLPRQLEDLLSLEGSDVGGGLAHR